MNKKTKKAKIDMTILDKVNGKKETPKKVEETNPVDKAKQETEQSPSNVLSEVESQFKNIMAQFNANTGFSVETGEEPRDTMIEVLAHPQVEVSIVLLLSYIRYCINHGIKKEITLKIGYNKPPSVPMNFAVNEELLGEIYPGDVVEIN